MVVGSHTAPVMEVIEDGHNGVLVDFFDTEALADKASHVLVNPQAYQSLRQRARETAVSRYDLHTQCLPAHQKLLNSLVD